MAMKKLLNRKVYRDKVYGCWTGKKKHSFHYRLKNGFDPLFSAHHDTWHHGNIIENSSGFSMVSIQTSRGL